ncbi:hypothetical protein ACN47E_007650 [Coniothyrium glycines]
MTPRRPSSAQADLGPQRLPFAAAESLLWGPEIKKQHQWLLERMRQLQSQHEACETRIKAMEVTAQAAETAAGKISHMEQQIIAMEAVDNDKVFEKWAAEEITRLSLLAERNKNIREKQMELEKDVRSGHDELDRVKEIGSGFRSLLRRLDLLDANREQDADKIQRLEDEVGRLRNRDSHGSSHHRREPSHTIVRVQQRGTPLPEIGNRSSTVDSETEDESSTRPVKLLPDPVEAIQSLEIKQDEDLIIIEPPVLLSQASISARQRLMKRPSIHDSKVSSVLGEVQHTPITAISHSERRPTPPPTQLVNRPSPRKRKQPELCPTTPRVTRSQARLRDLVVNEPQLAMLPNDSTKTLQISDDHGAKRRRLSKKDAEVDLSKQPTQITGGGRSRAKKPHISPPDLEDFSKDRTQIVPSDRRGRARPKKTQPIQPAGVIDLTQVIEPPSPISAPSPGKRKQANYAPKQKTESRPPTNLALPKTPKSNGRKEHIVILRHKPPVQHTLDGKQHETHFRSENTLESATVTSSPRHSAIHSLSHPVAEATASATGTAKAMLTNARTETLQVGRRTSPRKGRGRPTASPSKPKASDQPKSPRKSIAAPLPDSPDDMLF